MPNHAWGHRDPSGVFHELDPGPLRAAGYLRPPFELACADGRLIKVILIVLTVAHLNHEPEDCREENLAALCQRCHNRHDGKSRRAGMRERVRATNGDLF